MNRQTRKYISIIVILLSWVHMVFGIPAFTDNGRKPYEAQNIPGSDTIEALLDSITALPLSPASYTSRDNDSLTYDSVALYADSLQMLRETVLDSLGNPITELILPDSLSTDSLIIDTGADTVRTKNFLDDVISGKNKDSLVYEVQNKMVYIYTDGDVYYQDMNLKADFMEINMDNKNIFAYGYTDTLGNTSRPEFYQGGSIYTMDTITYNIDTSKAKIKGVETQEGDGFLISEAVKKMPDNTVNIAHGKYTTCDHLDHPHFYLAMNKAKLIPGKKVVVGRSYFVMEDVPIVFPFLPFGFFPITSGRSSGFITPTFGEEYVKGFFIRDGGYYFAFNDYMDLTVLGGIYTLGSWDAKTSSRYIKRYKYNGTLNAHFAKDIRGEKGSADYTNGNNFSIKWTHTQDPKFRPNSTFSASVDYSTGSYTKNSSTTMNDYLNSQTNSSISYSKSWPGTPFSFSTSFQHSQYSRDTTVQFTFPNATFNVSKVYPFKRKNPVGKAKWYEKISLTYKTEMKNTVKSKEKDLFTDQWLKDMRNGVNHTVPVSASWTVLNYINIGPTFNYNERWYFSRVNKEYSQQDRAVITTDTTYGFYRVYNYSVSGSMNTKIYGMFQFKGENPIVRAVRHVMTPSVSFSYSPDFSHQKYGYYRNIQTDSTGTVGSYTPYENVVYGIPGRGQAASISFSLGNNLEAKIRSDKDTSGYRKISLIDNLSISSSYNFLADSLNLAPFSVSLKTTITKNYALNVSATLDPYQIDDNGRKINQWMIRKGKLVRLTALSTSFGYTFNSSNSPRGAMNDINSPAPIESTDFFTDPYQTEIDPATRRMMMTSQYYDFNIPWNFGFNYSFSYQNSTGQKNIVQTLGFQASVNLTDKWGLSFSSFGYDFEMKTLTPGQVTITRDLHCWQMNMTWVPIGYRKSWSFNISVRSPVLKDLKYDKSSSFYDTLYD